MKIVTLCDACYPGTAGRGPMDIFEKGRSRGGQSRAGRIPYINNMNFSSFGSWSR